MTMDRIALITAGFVALLMALNGSLTTPSVAARKGYSPWLGLALGVVAGLLGAALGAMITRFALPQYPGLGAFGGLAGGFAALALARAALPDRGKGRETLPEGDTLRRTLAARHLRGGIASALYRASIVVAL